MDGFLFMDTGLVVVYCCIDVLLLQVKKNLDIKHYCIFFSGLSIGRHSL